MLRLAAAAFAALISLAPPTAAQTAPQQLKVLGTWDMLSQFRNHEKPFWTERLPALSGGRLAAEVTAFNTLKLNGSEIVQLMRIGEYDLGATVLSYIAAADPFAEGADLAGVATDLATARKVADAFLPALSRRMEERAGIRILALWPYPAQMLFCNAPIAGLESLAGKKVRVSLATTSDLLEAFGAVTLQIPFNEVAAKLKEGAVDCLVTGTLPANTAKLHEVTTHLYRASLGWSMIFLGANVAALDALPEQDRATLTAGAAELRDRLWQVAAEETEQGLLCNAGQPGCVAGNPGRMTIVEMGDADRARLARAVEGVVVRRWADRCGADCAEAWTKVIAPALAAR